MENLFLLGTISTPTANFTLDGRLLLEGRSLPENVNIFYDPLIEWASYLEIGSVKFDINLEYFNSASSIKILDLLKALEYNSKIETVTINWHYEEGDEDNLEAGETFAEFFEKCKFEFLEYDEAA